MTEQETPPTTTSEISNIRSHTSFQAIDATFYNLTDTEGRAIAGLMVLLDRLHRPVRAELHLYEDLDGFVRENTIRQSQLLLQQRYYSREPVSLRIMYSAQDRNAYDVPLPTPENAPSPTSERRNYWLRIAAVVAGVLLILALVWFGFQLLGNGGESSTVATPETVDCTAEPDNEACTGDEVATTDESAVDSAPVAQVSQDLPASQNARNDLTVGMRVVIQPGLQSNILSEPNLGVGESVGVILDGEGAQLLDGPVLRKGESDTIVWWYALTDGGVEGWVPANTSQLTLLIPADEIQ